MKKITLFLMTKKGLECLRTIIQTFGADYIAFVFTHEDLNVENDYSDEICDLCEKEKIEWNKDFAGSDLWKESPIKTDFAIAIGWRWIIYNSASTTVLVLHDSLLPKYKGWNPLVTALINGDAKIGVSAFIVTDKVDMGQVILKEFAYITYPIKIEQAIEKLIPAYQVICCKIMELLNEGRSGFPKIENREDTSYSMWRDEEDYRIDWSWPADKIVRFVNAVGFPYSGAFTNTNYWEGKIKVTDCEVYFPEVEISDRQKHIGKVIFREGDKYVVVAGEGLVQINEMSVQTSAESVKWNKFRIRFK